MKLKFLYLLITLWPLSLAGLTLQVSPGEIAASGPSLSGEKTVTVCGSVNAADLDYLASAIAEGATLDLSGANVAPYSGKIVGVACAEASANVFPPYIMGGLRAKRIMLPVSLTEIADGALLGASIDEIEIPAAVKKLGAAVFAGCRNLSQVTFAEGSSVTIIPDRAFDGCTALSNVTLPASLTRIGHRAFAGCRSLTTFDPGQSLEEISSEAFAASGLTEVDLSSNTALRSVGARAWAECKNLTSIRLPARTTLKGEGVMMECPLLESVTLPSAATTLPAMTLEGASTLSEMILPEGVDSIGAYALAGLNNVKSLTLPGSLVHIGDGAFEGWTALSEIEARDLDRVPTLGEDVWADINRPSVVLRVTSSAEQAFLDALQWQDFSISSSGIISIAAPDAITEELPVRASYHGTLLTVEAPLPVMSLSIHAINGTTIQTNPAPPASTVTVDTSALPGAVTIVSVTLDNHPKPIILKLLRK